MIPDEAALVSVRGVTRAFPTPAGEFVAIADLTLSFARGEFVAVVGQSGSGKSTLLNLLAGIDRPTRGEIVVDGTEVHRLSERELTVWRGRSVGIVFQFFQLLPTLTALENVMLPMDFCDRYPSTERRPRALELLAGLGVADQADKMPATMSGGQQQRVAVARALANDPALVLADEPTGNLDSRTSAGLLELFAGLVDQGRTLIMVTHEREAIRYASRTVALTDGRRAEPEAAVDA